VTGAVRRRAISRRLERARGSPPRVGIALAGGGPLGGIYEIGALLALADSLDGLDLNALDAYVGVSSGSFVAAALANGISPAQMHRLFIEPSTDATLGPELFLRPAFREFRHRLITVPGLLAGITREWLRDPLHYRPSTSLAMLARAMPTGLFDNVVIERHLAELFCAQGRRNDFRALPRKLYLVATNLDTGAPVIFGSPGHDDVPVSRAILASAALPGLFPPVEIHGEHYVDGALNKTLHASVALQEGVRLLLCVNPLVPYDARVHAHHGERRKLHHRGLPTVLSQTFRAIIHSRMRVGMEQYHREFPEADVVLLEPSREDGDMFFANIFSYAQRARLCAHAFQHTRQQLLATRHALAGRLARHGVRLRLDRLHDQARTLHAAATDARPLHASGAPQTIREVSRDLDHALHVLEGWLARAA
jgi:predicted acylesterase/phospholipase RssA